MFQRGLRLGQLGALEGVEAGKHGASGKASDGDILDHVALPLRLAQT